MFTHRYKGPMSKYLWVNIHITSGFIYGRREHESQYNVRARWMAHNGNLEESELELKCIFNQLTRSLSPPNLCISLRTKRRLSTTSKDEEIIESNHETNFELTMQSEIGRDGVFVAQCKSAERTQTISNGDEHDSLKWWIDLCSQEIEIAESKKNECKASRCSPWVG